MAVDTSLPIRSKVTANDWLIVGQDHVEKFEDLAKLLKEQKRIDALVNAGKENVKEIIEKYKATKVMVRGYHLFSLSVREQKGIPDKFAKAAEALAEKLAKLKAVVGYTTALLMQQNPKIPSNKELYGN